MTLKRNSKKTIVIFIRNFHDTKETIHSGSFEKIIENSKETNNTFEKLL